MEHINDKNAPAPLGPYSDAIRSGNLLFISGQAPFNAAGVIVGKDIAVQTTQAMNNLASLLDSVGLEMRHVIKATVYLSNWDNFKGYNEVYKKFMGYHKPARATVEVTRLAQDSLIEMEFIAEFS